MVITTIGKKPTAALNSYSILITSLLRSNVVMEKDIIFCAKNCEDSNNKTVTKTKGKRPFNFPLITSLVRYVDRPWHDRPGTVMVTTLMHDLFLK